MSGASSSGISLSKINEITTRINSEQEIGSLLSVIMDIGREFLGTEGASLLLYDEDSGELVFNVTSGDTGQSLQEKRIPQGEGIAGECAQKREIIIVDDAASDPRVFKGIDQEIGFETRNLAAAPLIARGQLIGVLELVNTIDGRNFSGRDKKLVSYLANMAALALQNRRLIRDLNVRVNELNCIYEISQSIQLHQDTQSILDGVLTAIRNVLEVDRASIIIKEDQNDPGMVRAVGFGSDDSVTSIEDIDFDRGVLGVVFRSGDPLLVRDYTRDLPFQPEFANRYRTRSFVSIPLLRDGKVIGVINVADKKNDEAFDYFELKVISTVAAQLADAYHRVLAKQREEELAAYRRDAETAAKIQLSSLPDIPSRVNGMEIATMYQACRDVGGDFYDLIYHSDDRISLLIADVSGKGVPAALFMEYSKTLLAGVIPRMLDPASTLRDVNLQVYNNTRMDLFVTVMLIQIEFDFKRLRLASAGHNYQILIHAKDRSLEYLKAKGTPIGTFDRTEYIESVVSYEPGDLLVLFTDGITEAEGPRDYEFYGEERLYECLKRNFEKSPADIIEAVYSEIREFQGSREPSDDATMLIARLV